MNHNSTEADAFNKILEWSNNSPDWQRDALRRLFSKNNLDEDDIKDLLEISKKEVSKNKTKTLGSPLSANHVPNPSKGNAVVTLEKICELKHVNALQQGQTLTFQKSGLTVIYGSNGAGKSGYARVLKQACRARRTTKDVILPNIHVDNDDDTPQAKIVFSVGGQKQSFAWQQGSSPDIALRAISVFDSQTANVHVDEANDLAYTPTLLRIVGRLAGACKSLDSKIYEETGILKNQIPSALKEHGFGLETAVGKLLDNLNDADAEQQVEKLAGLSQEQEARLNLLAADYTGDPETRIRQIQEQKSQVNNFIRWTNGIADVIKPKKLKELDNLRKKYDEARDLASRSSEELFSAEPLRNVGSDVWCNLWEAARKYSDDDAYPEERFPFTDGEAKCVLCQQELTPDASKRLNRFEDFINNEIKKKEDDAKKAYIDCKEGIARDIELSLGQLSEMIASIGIQPDDTGLKTTLQRIGLVVKERLGAVLQSLENGAKSNTSPISPILIARLETHRSDLDKREESLLAKKNSPEHKELTAEHDDLVARKWLATMKKDVLAQIVRFADIDVLEKAQKTTTTNRVTLLSTEIADILVTNRLKKNFTEEIEKLGVDNLNIELEKSRSSIGTAYFNIQIKDNPNKTVSRILSEGEQRCAALGAFLAELVTAETNSGIVFDDPVSSLDHIYRGKFAERLANESLKRQVVIFTHDIAFLVSLQEACLEISDCSIAYRIVSQGKNGAAGLCSSEPPPNILSVDKVISKMRSHLNNVRIHDESGETGKWQNEVGSFAQQIRGAWERAVENAVSPVIKRLSHKVQTNGLSKLTVINAEHCKIMREAYGRVSKLLHSQSDEANPTTPSPDCIEEEINILEKWVQDIKGEQGKLG